MAMINPRDESKVGMNESIQEESESEQNNTMIYDTTNFKSIVPNGANEGFRNPKKDQNN
jgi:hypothetical protein